MTVVKREALVCGLLALGVLGGTAWQVRATAAPPVHVQAATILAAITPCHKALLHTAHVAGGELGPVSTARGAQIAAAVAAQQGACRQAQRTLSSAPASTAQLRTARTAAGRMVGLALDMVAAMHETGPTWDNWTGTTVQDEGLTYLAQGHAMMGALSAATGVPLTNNSGGA